MASYVPQTLEELLEVNRGYLNWLRSVGGTEAERRYVESLCQLTAGTTQFYYQPYAEYRAPELLKEIGGTAFSPYTYRSMSLAIRADPLNLVFTGNAGASSVARIFADELFPPGLDWRSTVLPLGNRCAETQYVFVRRDQDPFQEMRFTIAMGGCLSNPRCHIRLFDGGYDTELGEFTLGAVHYEHFDLSIMNHVIEDWDRSQAFVQHLFEATQYCRSIRLERFQSEEEIQNVPNDGLATVIDLE